MTAPTVRHITKRPPAFRKAQLPRVHYLLHDRGKRLADRPGWEMSADFREIAVITDVIADTRPVDIRVVLFAAGNVFDHLKRLQDRTGIFLPSAEVVDLALFGMLIELVHQAGDIC